MERFNAFVNLGRAKLLAVLGLCLALAAVSFGQAPPPIFDAAAAGTTLRSELTSGIAAAIGVIIAVFVAMLVIRWFFRMGKKVTSA